MADRVLARLYGPRNTPPDAFCPRRVFQFPETFLGLPVEVTHVIDYGQYGRPVTPTCQDK